MSTEWSRDSRYMLFSSSYVTPTGVYIWDRETREARLIIQARRTWPSMSPDGSQIAIVYNEEILRIVSASTGETLFQLSQEPYFAGDDGAAWSPDGTQLVFAGGGLYLVDSRLEHVTLLTPAAQANQILDDDTIYYVTPLWSPDGTQIAYTGLEYSTGIQAIYVSDVRTLEQQRIAEGTNPVWSRDGHWIAFACREVSLNATAKSDICIVRPDGSDLQQLTDTNLAEVYPQWIAM
jgi:Tol biopolymer transport system component